VCRRHAEAHIEARGIGEERRRDSDQVRRRRGEVERRAHKLVVHRFRQHDPEGRGDISKPIGCDIGTERRGSVQSR
jgi:hypothetical protein